MQLEKFTSTELEKHWTNTEFVTQTIAQINKDFTKFNLKSISKDEANYTAIAKEVGLILMDFMKHQSNDLPQLMYTIDIPQSVFPQLMSSLDFYQDLTEIIIRREALKVYLRKKFS